MSTSLLSKLKENSRKLALTALVASTPFICDECAKVASADNVKKTSEYGLIQKSVEYTANPEFIYNN